MKTGLKNWLIYTVIYLAMSFVFLIYEFIKKGIINWDYIGISGFSFIVYTVIYVLFTKFSEKD